MCPFCAADFLLPTINFPCSPHPTKCGKKAQMLVPDEDQDEDPDKDRDEDPYKDLDEDHEEDQEKDLDKGQRQDQEDDQDKIGDQM